MWHVRITVQEHMHQYASECVLYRTCNCKAYTSTRQHWLADIYKSHTYIHVIWVSSMTHNGTI